MQELDYTTLKAHHFDGVREDFLGNGDIGRYVFLPGSNSRAKIIAEKYFKNLKVKLSSRGHDLYLGDLEVNGNTIRVAAISTGMGAPSVDILLTELIILGAKRFLRIGTAGAMQPDVRVGDVVFATAAVRDEATSSNYVPLFFPAIANSDMIIKANELKPCKDYPIHLGIVHSKDSLYAREFLSGPSRNDSIAVMEKMISYGVVATEMECSHIYVLSQVFTKKLGYNIKSGCVLGVVGDNANPFADPSIAINSVDNAIDFAVNLISNLANSEVKLL